MVPAPHGDTGFRVRGIPGVGTYVDGVWQVATGGFLTRRPRRVSTVSRSSGVRRARCSAASRSAAPCASGPSARPTSSAARSTARSAARSPRRDGHLHLPFSDKLKSKFTFSAANRDGYIKSLRDGRVRRRHRPVHPEHRCRLDTDRQVRHSGSTQPLREPVHRAARRRRRLVGCGLVSGHRGGCCTSTAGMPYSQISQMAGFPGGEVGQWENRSETTIPNAYHPRSGLARRQVLLHGRAFGQFPDRLYGRDNEDLHRLRQQPVGLGRGHVEREH